MAGETMLTCRRCGRDRMGRARGLCNACYTATRDSGEIVDYPTKLRKTADVIEDWNWLAAAGETRETAAERMGMKPVTLRKAISRARRAGMEVAS